MSYTNSSLVEYTHISPNRNSPRNQPITKITIHHMAGVLSLEQFDSIVSKPQRQMSSNYAIDKDGRIGLFCPERDRSWCSSSAWNDNRAITIEVSNSAYGDNTGWPISEKVYARLIQLCIDICKRNGIKKLEYTGNLNGSLTRHCDLAATGCPGPWIKAHTTELCNKVNEALNNKTQQSASTQQIENTLRVGTLVSISADAVYYSGVTIPLWVKNEKWYISSISGDRAVVGYNEAKSMNIQSPINVKYLLVNGQPITKRTTTNSSYIVKLTKDTPIYATPNNISSHKITSDGSFTIVEEQTVNGTTYGKLKSGIGWVIIKNSEIKIGDKIRVVNPIIYGTNNKFMVYEKEYVVLEINDNRVVISSNGKDVTTAIDIKNIEKI